MKWRFSLINIIVCLTAIAVWIRLAYWQVVAAGSLKQRASEQRLTIVENQGERGKILASDGQPLAANKVNYRLIANPKVAVKEAGDQLEKILSASDAAELRSKLARTDLSWISLSQSVSQESRELIEALNLEGISFESLPMRFYPEGTASAHLLGFVGRDEAGLARGYFGLEGYYDRQLSGRKGRQIYERDAFGRPIVISGQSVFPAVDGTDVHTGLDRTVQLILAEYLARGLERYRALSGTVTVMDPNSGQILGMVSLPGYDPYNYQNSPEDMYKNPVVSESYEPGSTFKVLIMAAALDAKVVDVHTKCDICHGPVIVSGYPIRTWNNQYYSNSSMTDILVHSDNVGMVFMARKLGRDRLYEYLKKFEFGQTTGVDLQDESFSPLREKNEWRDIDMATAAFGQGIAVTPLQMVRGVAAIANGGYLVTPKLSLTLPVKKEKILSSLATAQTTEMMIKAVESGEAKWAKPKGYVVAGKTGTAQIPVEGHYDQEKTIASFVGFAPAHDPKFVMLVTLREPQSSPWGSETAAPLWFDIATELFKYFKIAPDR